MIAWLAMKLAHKLAPVLVVLLGLALIGTAGGWGVTAFKLGTARLQVATAETALAAEKLAHQQLIGAAEAFARIVAERERLLDQAHQQRLTEIEHAAQEAQRAADIRQHRLADDHRAGLVRVRAEVCEGSPRGGGQATPPAAAGLGLRGTPVRENPAVLAVRVGADADARLRQCRAYVIAQAERCPQVDR